MVNFPINASGRLETVQRFNSDLRLLLTRLYF